MHFECGDALIRQWSADGLINTSGGASQSTLIPGDRGPDVVRLQTRLQAQGAQIAADGIYGPDTQAAVMAFQASQGLAVDGIANAATLTALG